MGRVSVAVAVREEQMERWGRGNTTPEQEEPGQDQRAKHTLNRQVLCLLLQLSTTEHESFPKVLPHHPYYFQ